MNWEDARLFLAIARAGQMLGAARNLGVNQATLSRRMTNFEHAIGSQLLHRGTGGCTLTDQGMRLFAYLERIEAEFIDAATDLGQTDTEISGTVRIGAPDGFGVAFLAPLLGELANRHPSLSVQLVPVPHSFSLSKREADIAIMVERPTQGRLVAQKLTDYTLGLYAARSYLQSHPTPSASAELSAHTLVGYVDDLLYAASLNYTGEFFRNWQSKIEISSAIGQFQTVNAGAGIGILHDYLAADSDQLVPVLPHLRLTRAYWTVYHESLRKVARIRAVADFLATQVNQHKNRFIAPTHTV